MRANSPQVFVVVFLLFSGALVPSAAVAQPAVAEAAFSNRASALPFPPDAREVEFKKVFGDISYVSRSPLFALGEFYRREMTRRGWQEDESATEFEDEEITMVFKHDDAKVEVELDLGSDGEVDVSLDCEEIDFTGTDDPAVLLAAGVPQPKSYFDPKQNIPLPDDVRDLAFARDEMSFKSRMALGEAFAHFSNMIKKHGFRESRRPILSDDRNYTEFRKGAVELSLNIFTHEYGTRLHIGYESDQKEKAVPPLADVATFAMPGGREIGMSGKTDAEIKAIEQARKPVDVTRNTGKVVITFGKDKYTFNHVAAYQTNYLSGDEEDTMLVFADKALPLNKMQQILIEKEDFSFGDMYEFDMPSYISIRMTKYPGFSFSVPGVGIGHGIENPEIEAQYDGGRVRATVKMPPEEIFDKPFSFEATIDAALMSRNTRVANFTDPVERSSIDLGGNGLPLPGGVSESYGEGSQWRKTQHAKLKSNWAEIAAFYRKQLPAEGWSEASTDGEQTLAFSKGEEKLVVTLHAPDADGYVLSLSHLDAAKARKDGILPEPGKGRLIMGNAHTRTVVISIGKQDYKLKPGQGAENPKSALNYTVAPATYPLVIKIPGEAPQTEKVEIKPDTAWGVITLPTGAVMVTQMY